MKFRSLLTVLLLLMVFGGSAYGTKPREAGVGVRYGFIEDQTNFYGTASGDSEIYIGFDQSEGINKFLIFKVPIFIQFNEDLIKNNHMTTTWFLDFHEFIQNNHPPYLKGTSYEELIRLNIFEVPTENTFTSRFLDFYPQFSNIINGAENPSLTADYNVKSLFFGKAWRIFYPSNENSRWLNGGVGIGLKYINGFYSVNICDPYFFSKETNSHIFLPSYRSGFCNRKKEVYKSSLSDIELSSKLLFTFYSYVGDLFEFNILSGQISGLNLIYTNNKDTALRPEFLFNSTEFISILYHF